MRLTVAYDGTLFHGFAPQPEVRTVAGELGGALSTVLRREVTLSCAGRTDAGVHAWGQVVSFDAPADVDPERLAGGVNSLVGPEIAVREAVVVSPEFDARFSARWRTYRYTILNRRGPDPFLARWVWHHPRPLELRSMVLACDPLVGEHDFASFCRRPPSRAGGIAPSTVRRVLDARWTQPEPGLLRFEVRASSFCQQMVRSLVGTLVEVGAGRRKAGEMTGIIRRETDRRRGPSHRPRASVSGRSATRTRPETLPDPGDRLPLGLFTARRAPARG